MSEGREVRMATHMGRLEARRGASNPFLSWHAFGIDQLFPAHSAQEAASAGTGRTHNKVDCILPSPGMGRLPALGQKVRYSAAGNAWRRCRHHFRIVDGKHVKSCYHLATTLHQAALDSSATMPPVGASFGQSRHLSQWRSSVTNSTPAIRPTHQVHQSTIEEGSQSNEVYSSSSNFSSDKPSGICDEGANASSLLIFFRNTPTGIPNPIYREPATCQ